VTHARFLQLHWLASYPATLLNRDDSGLAKRLPFGNATRTRISSQCLKRHWRTVEDEWALAKIGPEMAVRSRHIPERKIGRALSEAKIGDEALQKAIVATFARLLYNPKERKTPEIKDRQALLIGKIEIDYLSKKAIEVAKNSTSPDEAIKQIEIWFKRGEKNNLKAMLEGRRGALEAGLEAALFGRMVTSDPDANTDAAIHVAHAFTVHKEETESDYFTVVDDLTQEAGEAGTAGLFDTELTAGLFYGYVVVDIRGLVNNLGGDAVLAGKVAQHLVHLIATVSPGAKKGSTAPYGYAEMMLVESGRRQPRTLANAFRTPVEARLEAAIATLSSYIERIDKTYGSHETRRHLSIDDCTIPNSTLVSLNDLAAFARDAAATWPDAA
jgi:CRISPR system Cascade subunit CasC